MTKQFEISGETVSQASQAQVQTPQPQTPPVASANPPQPQTVAQQQAPVQQAPVQQTLIDNLPELPVQEKPKKKKAAPAPAPAPEPEKKPETVDEAQANLNADLDNIKADFEDMVRILTAQSKPAVDPKEIELLKSELDAREKIIQEKDAQIAKLKKIVEAALG